MSLAATLILAAFTFPTPVPGQLTHVEVPGELRAVGVPVRLDAFVSKEKYADLVRYYVGLFKQAGLYIPPPKARRRDELEPQLTALDPKTGKGYSVLFLRNRDKERTVTIVHGEAEPLKALESKDAAESFLPLPPQATRPLTSSSEGARTLTFQTQLTGEQVIDFYAQTLGPQGWVAAGKSAFRSRDGQREIVFAFSESQPNAPTSVSILERTGLPEGSAAAPVR